MFSICRYEPAQIAAWNGFAAKAKNGLFLFQREYMDYHADRFPDHSLCILRDGALFALLPACERNGRLESHGGLTFGGIVSDERMKTTHMLAIGCQLQEYLRTHGMCALEYKAIPHMYSEIPAEEDSYALFRMGATLEKSEVTAALYRSHPMQYAERRQRGIRKALRQNLAFERSGQYDDFFGMVTQLLDERFDARPTHSADEMKMLAARFPANIALWVARDRDGAIVAGVLMYLHARVAHTQYLAANARGKALGALDALLDHLIREIYTQHAVFDFGISTEQGGHFLNVGLVTQKEEFGARAVLHQSWTLRVA